MKYPRMEWGIMEAVVNRLGGEEGVKRFLRGELVVSEPDRRWREENGVIYFSVTSDGTTGPQWIERLSSQGVQISDWAKRVLNSPDFVPTSGVTTEVAILKGMLFENADRVTEKIRAEASRRKLTEPNPEVACLIREASMDKEWEAMGLWWIVVMHEPIKDSDGLPSLLYVSRDSQWLELDADCVNPDDEWDRGYGFVFVDSQVSLGS